jgi:predicted P-loop ATPase
MVYMDLKIAYGNSRFAKKWSNKEISFEALCARCQTVQRTTETVAEYQKMDKAQRDEAKDHGGYVLGQLKRGIRKADSVALRSAVTLDADYADGGFIQLVESCGYKCFLYSTHSHTPEKPRYRLIVCVDRDMTPDEYGAVARLVANEIGIDYFDDSTYEANRLMYWQSTPSDGEYVFKVFDGKPVDVDACLTKLADWQDCSLWPTSSRQSEIVRREITRQQDPLTKGGVVGAFCRAYSIEDAISAFLPDIYEPSAVDGRYDYIPADSSAGVVLYEGKWAYSHHATDPACGKLLNAFDMVRIHKFGGMDEKKSFNAMADFAVNDDNVKILLDNERMKSAEVDFKTPPKDWKTLLKYYARSKVLENSVWNEMLILRNDPEFANFAYNELAHRIQVTGPLPWDRPSDNRFWRDADTAQLKAALDIRYGVFSSRNHEVCFTKVADDRRFHPIRDYLDSLPAWDGSPRVETLLVRCMEADDTPYVRAVTRKTLAAAVARIYHPGTKFDSVLVFDGAQGIGKSTLFKDLAGEEYYSETLSLTDMNDKSGAEKLQGFWVVEIGELAGMKKADIEKVKAFLSTADDKYRPSYGKTVESHPRQCVIIGSVNGERGYLRDITGNRRFWVVKLRQEEQAKNWSFTPAERDQIWAEAKAIYEGGERLYLDGELINSSEEAQREAMESDERQGMVEDYLNTLLPDKWESMDIYERREFISDKNDPTKPKGKQRREYVSNIEIWAECFGRNIADLKPADSYSIAALMTKVNSWKRTKDIKHLALYGRQRLYRRVL